MLGSHFFALSRFTAPVSVGLIALLLASCENSTQPLNAGGSDITPKPKESVEREQAPVDRAQALTAKLNLYRQQTFGSAQDVSHVNVLFTAAKRHAAYLNTINSKNYNRQQGSSGAEDTQITPSTNLNILRNEALVPTAAGNFPAFYTDTLLYNRVAAVVGSTDLLNGNGSSGVRLLENYVFNGNIANPADARNVSAFRGFNLDLRTDADPTKYVFDESDNLWYSRNGRLLAMRAATRAVGYASRYDASSTDTIYPLLGGRFRGVWISLETADLVAQRGFWPNEFNSNVNPYGLDTDIDGRVTYCGPPIHVTLPVAEPILGTSAAAIAGSVPAQAAAGVVVSLRKLVTTPTGVAQSDPQNTTSIVRTFKVLWSSGSGTTTFYSPALGTNANYEYSGAITRLPIIQGFELRDGEFFLIPTEPLEPNSWYEVGIRLRTTSYSFEDVRNSNSQVIWQFKTNGNTPPVNY